MIEEGIGEYAKVQTTMCIQYTGNTVYKQQCVHSTQTKIKSQ